MSALVPGPVMDRAVAFAATANRGGVQTWMLWAGWEQHVGCHQCADEGPAAPCWGVEGCHRFEDDCGCITCAELEADHLAGVGAQTDQSMDGRAG